MFQKKKLIINVHMNLVSPQVLQLYFHLSRAEESYIYDESYHTLFKIPNICNYHSSYNLE
jgi:hypothetical protein